SQEGEMARRFDDRGFDEEETMEQDPLGEDGFDAEGFDDAPNGGPRFSAADVEDDTPERRPGRLPQKLAGIPEREQHRPAAASRGGHRPDGPPPNTPAQP